MILILFHAIISKHIVISIKSYLKISDNFNVYENQISNVYTIRISLYRDNYYILKVFKV
jgi:hypothetical protein